MPDERGKLSPAEERTVVQWLKDSGWTDANICPISLHAEWSISEHIVFPITYAGGAIRLGGEVVPFVMVRCEDCGYTRFFNAVMMGLLPPSKDGKDG